MDQVNKVMQLLGLARRAGAVAPGTDAVRHAIRAGEARVVLFAGDASQAQLDKIGRTLHERRIPRARLGDRNALGAAVGLAPLSAVAVTDASLAEQVVAELGDLLLYDSVAV
jgi:ribosomal protein L7Ae-like RNA K-turn-binding protein